MGGESAKVNAYWGKIYVLLEKFLIFMRCQ